MERTYHLKMLNQINRHKVILDLLSMYCMFAECEDPSWDHYAETCADAITLLQHMDTVGHALRVLKAHGWKDDSTT